MPDPAAPPPLHDDLDERALRFASSELGPASERLLAGGGLAAVRSAVGGEGRPMEDAVLAELHAHIGHDRRVADEFVAYFLFDLMKMGRISMSHSSRLRRFLDTGDLVLSVFGDLWGDLSGLRFESRNQFTALFAQRMGWKAADQARRMTAQRRSEHRRVPLDPADLGLAVEGGDEQPLRLAIQNEEKQRLILILLRLKERDRELLTLHLKDVPLEAIARKLDLSYDAARQALKRALGRARELAAQSEARRPAPTTPASGC